MTNKIKIEFAVGIIILVAGLMSFAIFFSGPERQDGSADNFAQNQSREKGYDGKNCKKDPSPVFSFGFTDTSKLKFLAPIGSVNAGSPGRSYVFLKDEINERAAIYAPIDAVLEGLVYARRNPNDKNAPGEYRLDFRVSCEVTVHFDHIDEVVDKIKELAPEEPADNTRDVRVAPLAVKAGELLGYSDGTDLSKGFDFFVINKSKKVKHLNPERWQWDQTKYADCPYDYFTPELKAQYYGMLRSPDGQELVKHDCGNPSHDVAGTASGGWFLGADSTDTQGKWLEIANANGKVEFNMRGERFESFRIRDYNPKLFPEEIKSGDETCYFGEGNWAHIKLLSEAQLSVVTGTGNCPENFPESQAVVWER